jgi:hypothetical protein
MHERIRQIPFAFGFLLLFSSGEVPAQTSTPVTVSAQANIYGAGHATPPAPGGSGAGVLPVLVSLPGGPGRVVAVSSVSGTIDFGACCAPNDADGIASAGNAPGNDWDGIAGVTISRGRFLAAVFLDHTEPADPPPGQLAISDIGFGEIHAGLRQTFFVGDGLDRKQDRMLGGGLPACAAIEPAGAGPLHPSGEQSTQAANLSASLRRWTG